MKQSNRPSPYAIETQELVKRFPLQRSWKTLLSRRRPEKTALDGVSIQVPPGEIFGLLGPNGAGKTTLIKILSTLILPTSGASYISGLDTVTESTAVRKRIGVVYGDERTFFWRLSVRENLRFYAALYRLPFPVADRRIDELLDLVGLTEAADTRMHHFSSGMKQRAAIARGMLSDPEILFMDEPTRSLDPLGAYEIRGLIRQRLVSDRRQTVLLATNLMAEAEALCDRVALLHHGKVQLEGEVATLRRTIFGYERYTLECSNVASSAAAQLESIAGLARVEVLPVDDRRLRLQLDCERQSEAIPLAIRTLVEMGAAVWSCAPQDVSLDEIFRITVGADGKERTGRLVEREA